MPATSDGEFTNRLVFLHGFTQTHHHWHPAAHALGTKIGGPPSLAFVDLPGHGLSRADRSTIDDAGEVAALGGAGTYVGYSMGGRVALLAALARPEIVERLVLIGATAGIEDAAERSARQVNDEERAARVGEVGVDRFLAEWLAAPMFAGLPPDDGGLAHRRRNDATGLAHSLRTSGTGRQPSVWSELGRLSMPVLVIAGALDTKFTDIGRRLASELHDASFRPIPGAGHAAHHEAPAETVDAIATWFVSH